MKYSEFIELLKKENFPGMYAIKDGRRNPPDASTPVSESPQEAGDLSLSKLLNDVVIPDFYKDISELEGVEFMQASYMIEKPHYEKREQLMCLIDGAMDIKMVPHFNRQEVYAGRDILDSKYNEMQQGKEPAFKDKVNTSPINFFSPKKTKYSNFERAVYQTEKLSAGDCIFIPAYYFY